MSKQDSTITLSIRVPSRIKKRLEKLASATDRSKSRLALEAINSYLELNEWQIQGILKGIKDADAGRMVDHDKVKAWVNSWGADEELERPRCD